MLGFNGDGPYVDLLPGDGEEDLVLGALDVQAQQVDGGVAQGQDHGVQGQALHLELFSCLGSLRDDSTVRAKDEDPGLWGVPGRQAGLSAPGLSASLAKLVEGQRAGFHQQAIPIVSQLKMKGV